MPNIIDVADLKLQIKKLREIMDKKTDKRTERSYRTAVAAVLRSIESTPDGVDKKALRFRAGMTLAEIDGLLSLLQKDNIVAVAGKGRGTKFIKGTNFASAFQS